ncbi:MAG: hypothetical protein ABSH48_06450 [Verrucomicrobiota bacterium]|jgi:hypothetical protein
MYSTLLADEVNLDSPQDQRDMMRRTVQTLRTAGVSGATLLLLGGQPDSIAGKSNGECIVFPTLAGHEYRVETKRV